jgi:chloramphenicol-sensitive protein RarD
MKRGILAAVGAYTLWGLFPIYWRMLESLPALEILAHRVIWALAFMGILLIAQKDLYWIRSTVRNRRTMVTYAAAATLLAINWLTYIWAVNSGYVVEASLGYFINPLVNFLLGVIFFGEKLRGGQLVAVLLAVAGVVYLTVSYGSLPWISLVLAFTFGIYGLIKKAAPLESKHGFSLEAGILFVPALAFLLYQSAQGTGAFLQQGPATTLLLILAGLVTAIPLLLFGFAARNIPLSMLGFIQYIAPTLQFLLGVFVYNEPFPAARLIGFSMIWLALLLYTLESVVYTRKLKARASLVEPL